MSKILTLKNGVTLEGATLMTLKEAKKYSEILPVNRFWWLKTPGNIDECIMVVGPNGGIYGSYAPVDDDNIHVRPVLEISGLRSSGKKVGDLFEFGKSNFLILSKTRALCTSTIGECPFREDWRADNAADYGASDVKRFLDRWYMDTVQDMRRKINGEEPIVLPDGIRIQGATLLSIEESRRLPVNIRKFKRNWWLRSPGTGQPYYAATVRGDGFVDAEGEIVCDTFSTVRPALIVDLSSSGFKPGEWFKVGDFGFDIISDTKALCTDSIGNFPFRRNSRADDAAVYETSDVRKYIEEWYANLWAEERGKGL